MNSTYMLRKNSIDLANQQAQEQIQATRAQKYLTLLNGFLTQKEIDCFDEKTAATLAELNSRTLMSKEQAKVFIQQALNLGEDACGKKMLNDIMEGVEEARTAISSGFWNEFGANTYTDTIVSVDPSFPNGDRIRAITSGRENARKGRERPHTSSWTFGGQFKGTGGSITYSDTEYW